MCPLTAHFIKWAKITIMTAKVSGKRAALYECQYKWTQLSLQGLQTFLWKNSQLHKICLLIVNNLCHYGHLVPLRYFRTQFKITYLWVHFNTCKTPSLSYIFMSVNMSKNVSFFDFCYQTFDSYAVFSLIEFLYIYIHTHTHTLSSSVAVTSEILILH